MAKKKKAQEPTPQEVGLAASIMAGMLATSRVQVHRIQDEAHLVAKVVRPCARRALLGARVLIEEAGGVIPETASVAILAEDPTKALADPDPKAPAEKRDASSPPAE